ncbi:MAG: NosD domain-containing protein [Candidatus Bathyarchaeia archaeon]
MKKTVSGLMLFLLFVSILTIAFNIHPVASDYVWSQTIYIRANGSIEPLGAPVSTVDYVTYTLTDNIVGNVPSYTSAIVIERNNIVLNGNGFTVQGKKTYSSVGFSLQNLSDVTIANVTIKDFWCGIKLSLTSNIKIFENKILSNYGYGLLGYNTSKTIISGNHIAESSVGFSFIYSFNDAFSGNNITNNLNRGMNLGNLHNATISENTISRSGVCIATYTSADNEIYGNNITEGFRGIELLNCNNTRIYQNNVTAQETDGISLYECRNIFLSDNLLNNDGYGLSVGGEELDYYLHSIDTSNLVDGKPVYYLINQKNLTINASTHPEVGYLALINSTEITIEGQNLTKSREGILIAYTNNSKIQNNNLTSNDVGIRLLKSSNNTITQNSFQRNHNGIYLKSSPNNTISENTLEENENIGIEIGYSPNCTISKNEISSGDYGIYLYYSSAIISQNKISVSYTCIFISDSSENVIYANNLANSECGIEFSNASRNIVYQNSITSNEYGIYAYSETNDNIIYENTIANNTETGIYLEESENNLIYHNNLLNNTQQVSSDGAPNIWDNGYPSGGNYWSDHAGVDADYDGISDIQYEIDAENVDRYPLMGPINIFDAGTWDGMPCNIDIISNSTVSDFQFNIDQKMISFNVTGLEYASGFCRITIPNIIVQELWQGNYTVLLNGEPCSFRNWTDASNTYIYVNYTHSEHQIIIIPEFPLSTIMLPLLNVLLTIAIIFTNKIKKKGHNTKL